MSYRTCSWTNKTSTQGCRRAATEDSDFCILHKPMPKSIPEFRQALEVQISEIAERDRPHSYFDFSGYVFPSGVAVRRPELGDGWLWFPMTMGTLDCSETVFAGDVVLRGLHVSNSAVFTKAEFCGLALFDDAVFGPREGPLSAVFADAVFHKAAVFRHVKFLSTANFSDAKFGVGSHGSWDEDPLRVSFERAEIDGELQLSGCKFHTGLEMRNTRIRERLFLEGAHFMSFTDVGLCDAQCLSLGFHRPTTRWIGLWSKRARCSVVVEDHKTSEEFWRMCRQTFEKEGKSDEADAAFYFERIAGRRAVLLKRTLSEKLISILGIPLDLVLRYTTAYGGSIGRLLVSWAVVIGSFASIFALVPTLLVRPSLPVWSVQNWLTSLYFSMTTFTTLGLGDIQPARMLGRLAISVEAAAGGVLMALLVLVLGRKHMR